MQSSSLQQLLQGIQPGLTLYGVLITFALVSFAVSRHFWRYEKELIAENIERFRDLVEGFRHRYIEPIISAELDSATLGAYEVAIDGLLADLYPKTQGDKGEIKRELVNDESIKQIVAEAALQDRLSELKETGRSAEKFLSSASGKNLLDSLDHLYEQKSIVARHYGQARHACAHTCYASLCFSLLALVGILNLLVQWPKVILFFWLFLAIQAAAYTIYSFSRLENHRRALYRMWEEFQLYGKI